MRPFTSDSHFREKKKIELIESIKISTKQNYLMMYKN